MPPHSCAYVILGQPKGGEYVPTIVVWSDMLPPASYHADIYSDAEGIFGHRQSEPSDSATEETQQARAQEMEMFLDAAAGVEVLREVLKAISQGRDKTTFKREKIPLLEVYPFLYASGGVYEIYDIRVDQPFPEKIQKLIKTAQARKHAHTQNWKPIRISVKEVSQ